MPAGLPGAPPMGKPPAPAQPSWGGAPGPAAALCRDSGIQPRQLGGERLRCQEGRLGQGMAFHTVPRAVGRTEGLRGTKESQVSSQVPLLASVPLRRPCFSWQPRPGTGVGMAARAGPAPGRQRGPARPSAAREQQDAAPGSCSHPAEHNLGAPRGEGAWPSLPALPLTPCLLLAPAADPRQLQSACRVNVRPHVTLLAGRQGRGCWDSGRGRLPPWVQASQFRSPPGQAGERGPWYCPRHAALRPGRNPSGSHAAGGSSARGAQADAGRGSTLLQAGPRHRGPGAGGAEPHRMGRTWAPKSRPWGAAGCWGQGGCAGTAPAAWPPARGQREGAYRQAGQGPLQRGAGGTQGLGRGTACHSIAEGGGRQRCRDTFQPRLLLCLRPKACPRW